MWGNSVGAIANSPRCKTGSYHPNYAGYLRACWQPTVIIIFAKKAWKFLCKVKCNTIRSQLLQGKSPGNEVWKHNFRQMFGDMQMLRQGLLRPYQNIPSIGGWGVVVVRFTTTTCLRVSSRASRMTSWERIYQNGGQGSRCCSGS